MKRMVGGQLMDIPDDGNGQVDLQEVRQSLGIPRRRLLMVQMPNGENRLLPDKGKASIPNYAHLLDAPLICRG